MIKALAVLLVPLLPAAAQPAYLHVPPVKAVDFDNDGQVSYQEWLARPAQGSELEINPEYEFHTYSSVWNNEPVGRHHGSGRLNSLVCWGAASETPWEEWMMLELPEPMVVIGTVTQGRGGPGVNDHQHVKSVAVQYSLDGLLWFWVTGWNGRPAEMAANTGPPDYQARAYQRFYNGPVHAKFVKIYPLEGGGMRAGVLVVAGADATCNNRLILDGPMGAGAISVSSYATDVAAGDPSCNPEHGVIGRQTCGSWCHSWCPNSTTIAAEWLQVDLGPAPMKVSASAVEGRYWGYYWGFVGAYTLRCSMARHATDADLWEEVDLTGAWSQLSTAVVRAELPEPMVCRSVRIQPTWTVGNWPSLKVELFGCPAPEVPLIAGLSEARGPAATLAASSHAPVASPACDPAFGGIGQRCDGPSWCPATASQGEWLQVNLGAVPMEMSYVQVQGRDQGGYEGAVTSYQLICSAAPNATDADTWHEVPGLDGQALRGARDRGCDQAWIASLQQPTECSSVRIRPMEWEGPHPSMRVELFGQRVCQPGAPEGYVFEHTGATMPGQMGAVTCADGFDQSTLEPPRAVGCAGPGAPWEARGCARRVPCGSDGACAAPLPICQPDGLCGSRRKVEPISTMPAELYARIQEGNDRALLMREQRPDWPNYHKLVTKWVRSAIQVFGFDSTEDAALLEVAYMFDHMWVQEDGTYNGRPGFYEHMVRNQRGIYVHGSGPNAWIWPGAWPNTTISGGAGGFDPATSEDFVLKYPRCHSYNLWTEVYGQGETRYNVTYDRCADLDPSEKCNMCPSGCAGTTIHEYGHSLDWLAIQWFQETDPDFNITGRQEEIFGWPGGGVGEEGANALMFWFMPPDAYGSSYTAEARGDLGTGETYVWEWVHDILGFNASQPWRYMTKDRRCPEKGLLETCDDAVRRVINVPADSWLAQDATTMTATSTGAAATTATSTSTTATTATSTSPAANTTVTISQPDGLPMVRPGDAVEVKCASEGRYHIAAVHNVSATGIVVMYQLMGRLHYCVPEVWRMVAAEPGSACAPHGGILPAWGGHKCCPASCGECGTSDCHARPGGRDHCCTRRIPERQVCGPEQAAPCALPPTLPSQQVARRLRGDARADAALFSAGHVH